MAKSALLKSSLAKKYWMAVTGLFLCLFLVGHLIGNLQLIFGDALQFNQYALFMTTNPVVKVMSYVTYISILFHAIDGIMLAYQNAKARPVGYTKNNPSANSTWSSRNMAVLGTLILIFIVTHMANFWARMHFDKDIPLQTVEIETMGQSEPYYHLVSGNYQPVSQVAKSYDEAVKSNAGLYLENRTEIYATGPKIKVADAYKDLYRITVAFFQHPNYGLIATLLYVLSMIVLAFHLWHGFASAFQSMGWSHPKYSPLIDKFGQVFSIVVPLLFAIIPIYIHFFLK